jgi:diaminohydroxyphosphoribosylaminopyrimidine deaminase/5-amino-6-(5-phosphoribosylamino)uracil reductase
MHTQLLEKALHLAKQRKGFCAPNPAVGAIIAKHSEILASGHHWGPSHPHAEVEALNQLSPGQAKQADLYVTLEPCCHYGKTPPCAEAIIQSGISRVFYGFNDPDERVSGKGIAMLEAAGVTCHHIVLPEIDDFYAGYQYWQTHQRPRVTAKIALSIDGKIAGFEGKPVKISGSVAGTFTHHERKAADAILTTARTVQHDDPRLDVRLAEGTFQKPVYILDRQLSISLTARIFDTAAEVILFHAEEASTDKIAMLQAKGATCIAVSASTQSGLAWDTIFREMGKRNVQDLWVEAGARCFESLILGNHLQQAYLYVSPKYIGASGVPAFNHENLFERVKKSQWQVLGEDAVCRLWF